MSAQRDEEKRIASRNWRNRKRIGPYAAAIHSGLIVPKLLGRRPHFSSHAPKPERDQACGAGGGGGSGATSSSRALTSGSVITLAKAGSLRALPISLYPSSAARRR